MSNSVNPQSNVPSVSTASLTDIFKSADTDGNGRLTVEEIQAISQRWLNESVASGASPRESLRWSDTSGDGTMTIDEFQAAQSASQVYKMLPGNVFRDPLHYQFKKSESYQVSDVFGFADQMGGVVDDLITADETAALGLSSFTFHDDNGDGLMSRAEHEAADLRRINDPFSYADTDGDGLVTHEQISALQLSHAPFEDYDKDGFMSQEEFKAAKELQQARGYDTFQYADRYGAEKLGGQLDELVTAEEVKALDRDGFTFHDEDGDGFMSRAEYVHYVADPQYHADTITELKFNRAQFKTDLARYIFDRLVRGESVTEEELRYIESDEGSVDMFSGDDWDTWMRFTQAQANTEQAA
jgi:Ca2+-binding EF-hand superfamily protein